MTGWKRGALFALVAAALLLALVGRNAAAQRGEPPAPAAAAAPRAGAYVGVATCVSSLCHGSPVPRADFDVLQNEYYTWLEEDRHARAFAVLGEERSRIIAANLGLAVAPADSPRCLTCHTLAPPPAQVAGTVEVEDGVSCESCHGPAGGWLASHHTAGAGHAASVAAGMVDLARPARRARLCLGCHLGDAGRTVDHELIAAGHPELVFELDNYTAAMPPHWPAAAALRDPERRDRRAAGHGAPAWAVGQAVAFRESMARIARRARGGRWPELAVLRCEDCHHDLGAERWRRGPDGAPLGQPAWSPAVWTVLSRLVAELAPGELPQLEARVGELATAAGHLAGPPERVEEAAEAAAAAVAGLEERFASARWDAPRLARLARAIAAAPPPADRQSAEQTLLALDTLTSELLARRPERAAAPAVATLEEISRTLDDPYVYQPDRFAALLERFGRQVEEVAR